MPNCAELAPGAILMLAGTVAMLVALEVSVTTKPSGGAARLRNRLPRLTKPSGITGFWVKFNEGGTCTKMTAVALPSVADVAVSVLLPPTPCTKNSADLAFSGIKIEAGTVATPVGAMLSVTGKPPTGAGSSTRTSAGTLTPGATLISLGESAIKSGPALNVPCTTYGIPRKNSDKPSLLLPLGKRMPLMALPVALKPVPLGAALKPCSIAAPWFWFDLKLT